MSRTPVREALSRLVVQGLVDSAPNRGARVATWTLAELEGVFDLRTALEPRLTALAVPAPPPPTSTSSTRSRRRRSPSGCPAPGRTSTPSSPANRAFHDRIVELAAHPGLAGALGSRSARRCSAATSTRTTTPRCAAASPTTVEIVDAFRADDPTGRPPS